jgi:hypothetical protein
LPWEDGAGPFAQVDAAKATGLPAIPFARKVEEGPAPHGTGGIPVFTITYPGLWAAHEVTLQVLPCERAYVAFNFVSKVETKILLRDATSGELYEKLTLQETRVRPATSPPLLEHWTDLAEAARLVRAFASCDEASLRPGDTAWEEEGRGRTVIGEDERRAFWHFGDKEYEVLIERLRGDGARERWTTRTLATWVSALDTAGALPAAIFETGLWVEIGLCKAGTCGVLVRQRPAWGPNRAAPPPARIDVVDRGGSAAPPSA